MDVISRFLRDTDIEIEIVDIDAADRALSGWRRCGKGQHRASLNFGDYFTYALAEQTGFPLLCTGDDLAATDLEVIRPASQRGNPG